MHVVKMEVFQKETCIRGYHEYESTWVAAIVEELHVQCQRELSSAVDRYAVAIIRDGAIVAGVLELNASVGCLDGYRRHDR